MELSYKNQERIMFGEQFPDQSLTQAEIKVLKGILISGECDVARELGISRSTISSHIQILEENFTAKLLLNCKDLSLKADWLVNYLQRMINLNSKNISFFNHKQY